MMTPQFLRRIPSKILLGGVVVVILIIGIVSSLSLLTSKKRTPGLATKQTNSLSEQATIDKETKRAFIKGLNDYGTYITEEKQIAVENVLYSYVSKQGRIRDLYTGTVRTGSLSQTRDPNGTLRTTFLIDIFPVNVTYLLGISGTTKDGPKPVDIRCAPVGQQKDPSVPCMDGMKRRE